MHTFMKRTPLSERIRWEPFRSDRFP